MSEAGTLFRSAKFEYWKLLIKSRKNRNFKQWAQIFEAKTLFRSARMCILNHQEKPSDFLTWIRNYSNDHLRIIFKFTFQEWRFLPLWSCQSWTWSRALCSPIVLPLYLLYLVSYMLFIGSGLFMVSGPHTMIIR